MLRSVSYQPQHSNLLASFYISTALQSSRQKPGKSNNKKKGR